MNRVKVWCLYTLYAILFALAFVFMLCFICAAIICIPAGLFLALVGGVMLGFDADFVLTELAPEIMLFGGLFMASGTAFLAFAAVKLGFAMSRLFCIVRKSCDRLRGWCT